MFSVNGSPRTFAQWQAMGYDKHSVVLNPRFTDISDFVPQTRLNHGTDLGTDWQTGLSTNAKWVAGTAPETTDQNGTWQVGARLFPEGSDNETPAQAIHFFPNPASGIINISINDTDLTPDSIRIINLAGTVVFQDVISSGTRFLQIPVRLNNGLYIVHMRSGDLTLF